MKRIGTILLFVLLACQGCGSFVIPEFDDSEAQDENYYDAENSSSNEPISFNLDGALGFVELSDETVDTSSSSKNSSGTLMKSNYAKLLSDGTTANFVDSSEYTEIERLMIGPDDDLYIAFSSPVTIAGGGKCTLIKVSQDNEYLCIDNLSMISDGGSTLSWLQFDGSGNVYYSGRDSEGGRLKKWHEDMGAVDLINENISIYKFIVANDGTVYMWGKSTPTSSYFLRCLRPNGNLQTVVIGSAVYLLLGLPDGIYVGIRTEEWEGLRKISDCTFENTYVFGSKTDGDANVLFDYQQYDAEPSFWIDYVYLNPYNEAFVFEGLSSSRSIWQFFPDAKPIYTSIDHPLMIKGLKHDLLVAGLDADDNHRFIIYDTATGEEEDLLGNANIEIYHVDHTAEGLIYFGGLRFSDNRYIIGVIDTNDDNNLRILDIPNFAYNELVIY